MKNPFAKSSVSGTVDTRSHWERLDAGYRALCKMIGGSLSPQNKRVRQAADMHLAKKKDYQPVRDTRQQMRYRNR